MKNSNRVKNVDCVRFFEVFLKSASEIVALLKTETEKLKLPARFIAQKPEKFLLGDNTVELPALSADITLGEGQTISLNITNMCVEAIISNDRDDEYWELKEELITSEDTLRKLAKEICRHRMVVLKATIKIAEGKEKEGSEILTEAGKEGGTIRMWKKEKEEGIPQIGDQEGLVFEMVNGKKRVRISAKIKPE